jgi:hypothetical protein
MNGREFYGRYKGGLGIEALGFIINVYYYEKQGTLHKSGPKRKYPCSLVIIPLLFSSTEVTL